MFSCSICLLSRSGFSDRCRFTRTNHPGSFLQIILADEVNRRDRRRLELRFQRADSSMPSSHSSSWHAPNTSCSSTLPVWARASSLRLFGYAAIGADHSVRFLRAADSSRVMAQARSDHSSDRTFLSPDLLILDDLGLHRMPQQRSMDLNELVIARHQRASFVIT